MKKLRNKKKRVVYIISKIDKAIAFEWIINSELTKKYELEFILLNSKSGASVEQYCFKNNIACKTIKLKSKKSYPRIILQLFWYFVRQRPSVVHTHLMDANLCGLTAAKLAFVKKRIYTRHHSTYHHEYFPKAVKWDLYSNWLATKIIAISTNVKNTLNDLEKRGSKKVVVIPHGFHLENFKTIDSEKQAILKQKYSISNNSFVVGVIARQTYWKGIQYIIPAFKEFLTLFPNAQLMLFNASGEYKAKIDKLLQTLPKNSYQSVVFEPDIEALYHIFDIYIHVPINKNIEAFGQTYIEALASGTPSIFTLSGIANDFVIHEENALVVPYMDSKAIFEAMKKLKSNPSLREKLAENGMNSLTPFSFQYMIQKLIALYD